MLKQQEQGANMIDSFDKLPPKLFLNGKFNP